MFDLASLSIDTDESEPRRPYIAGFAELLDVLTARLHRLDAAHDRRSTFCRAYTQYVAAVRALASSGRLAAAAGWTERLEVDFACQYLRALDGWDRRDFSGTPAPWRAAFAQSRYGDLSPLDDLRLSVYAHVSYDLPISLARVGLSPKHRTAREAAYRALTPIAAHCLLGGEAASNAGPMAGEWIAVLRRRAWADAVALYDAEDDEHRTALFTRIERDAMTSLAPAHSIL
jgi:hypothetical protein